jgi:hypothetical protein
MGLKSFLLRHWTKILVAATVAMVLMGGPETWDFRFIHF